MCKSILPASFTTTIQFLGVLFGGIVFGQISDVFGRKNVLIGLFLLHGLVDANVGAVNKFDEPAGAGVPYSAV